MLRDILHPRCDRRSVSGSRADHSRVFRRWPGLHPRQHIDDVVSPDGVLPDDWAWKSDLGTAGNQIRKAACLYRVLPPHDRVLRVERNRSVLPECPGCANISRVRVRCIGDRGSADDHRSFFPPPKGAGNGVCDPLAIPPTA